MEPEDKGLKTLKYHSKLVGVTFEGRQDVIKMLKGDEPLRVRREADNEYDPKAVAVDAEIAETWQPIGYIAKDKNKDISAALDAGNEVEIAIASITGGGTKSFGVNIALSYEKVSDVKKTEVVAAEETGAAITDAQARDLRTLEQIKSLLGVGSARTKYSSRVLGRTIEVNVRPGGHIGLDGFTSGSKFPERFYAPFEKDRVLEAMSLKFGVEPDDIEAIWDLNRDASTGYGTAIHAALENYDKHYRLGDKIKSVKKFKTKPDEVGPNKALSKNPFLKKIVEDFHEKFGGSYLRLSEQFVWHLDKKLCGSIDRLKVVDSENKVVRIQDFKTDGDINEKKYQKADSPFKKTVPETLLGYHWLQLSFYAYILKQYGYTVEGLDIYWLNPTKLTRGENAWEHFESSAIDIDKVV